MPKQKVRKAVLTDAGYATRFLPIAKTVPKSMLPLGDRPIMQHVIEECMMAGITEIVIVATEEGKPVYEDYFHNTAQNIFNLLKSQGKEDRFKKISDVFDLPDVVVITQDKSLPYGNGTPILCAQPYVGNEPFLCIFSDDLDLTQTRAKEMIAAYYSAPDDIEAVFCAKEIPGVDVTRYGMLKLKEGTENLLDFIIEKPKPEESPSELVHVSGHLFSPLLFDYLAPTPENLGKDNELWLTDGVARMAKEHKVLVHPMSGEWRTTGDPYNYLQTVVELSLQNLEYGEKFREYLKSLVLN